MKVYLDNAATTKVDERVAETVKKFMITYFGNASSLHGFGKAASDALKEARKAIAESLNAEEDEILFTSGGTESNNLAIKGLAFKQDKNLKNHIISTKIEHPSVSNVLKHLENNSFRITFLDVNHEGFIDLKQLQDSITNKTFLVSIIHGNNEIGTIQDLDKIGRICQEKGVALHIDACQSYMKSSIDVKKQNLALVTINAHKLHGPKGVGALYVRKGLSLESLMHGGGQEKRLRSGTENIPGILGFAEAVKLSRKKDIEEMTRLRDYMIKELSKIEGVRLNGPTGNKRLCNNINFSFEGIEGEALLSLLDIKEIAVSTGSACSSSSLKASHVLLAIGLTEEQSHGSLRISLSKYTTRKEIDYALDAIKESVERLRSISPAYDEKNYKKNKNVRIAA